MPASGIRVPEVWGDSLATVGMVLNQEGSEPVAGEPITPGVSPGTHHFIKNYAPYTPLEEWEEMKANIAQDKLPRKRTTMLDYRVDEQIAQADILPYRATDADAMAVTTADLIAGGSQRSPAQGSTSARSRDGPKGSGQLNSPTRLARLKQLPLLTGTPVAGSVAASSESTNKVAGRIVAQKSPRRVARFAEPSSPRSDPPSPREIAKSQFFGEDPEPSYNEANMKIRRVKANALKKSVYDGRAAGPNPLPNKDKAQYGTGDRMRPAREMNRDSKKRLNDLLKLPTMRIEAGEKHSSRTYELIPSQNLRVM